jgi:DNA-binding transcriptional ArsR family regulator
MDSAPLSSPLDAAFFALADRTRRAILVRLAGGEATVMQLAEPFAMTQPAVSRHLKVLERAGLITRSRQGSKRPCRLAKKGVDTAEQYLAMLRQAMETNYNRLDAVLAATAGSARAERSVRAIPTEQRPRGSGVQGADNIPGIQAMARSPKTARSQSRLASDSEAER